MLVNVLEQASLATSLEADGTFTVFAPNNDAFKKNANVKLLGNVEQLKKVLLRHVIPKKLTDSMFTDTAVEHTTMNRDKIKIWKVNENKMIGWNKVTAEVHQDGENGIEATNGNIYVISSVLMDMSDI